jgi:hypothetical protein
VKIYFKSERANSLWGFLYNTNGRPHSQPMIGNWWKPVKGLDLYSKEPVEFNEEMDGTSLVLTFDLKSAFCQSGDFWESMSILCGGNDYGSSNPKCETRGVHAVLVEDWSEVPWMLELDETDEFFVKLDMMYLRERILLDPQKEWHDVPDWVFTKESPKAVSE